MKYRIFNRRTISALYVFVTVLILVSAFPKNAGAQAQNFKLKLNPEQNKNSLGGMFGSGDEISTVAVLFFLNPILMLEDKRFYAGLTKELSAGKFPYGRFAVEYSLIFRKTHVNHLRFSYNFDIPIITAEVAAVLLSAGGGYFTDFDKKGYFPQASIAFLIPAFERITSNIYFKGRYTIMDDKSRSNIVDITFGLSASYYF